MTRHVAFRRWARAQRHRQDAVGDLCRDLLADGAAPAVRDTGAATRRYLEHRADPAIADRVLAAFDAAIAEWEQSVRRGV